jgi:hypothetical protein
MRRNVGNYWQQNIPEDLSRNTGTYWHGGTSQNTWVETSRPTDMTEHPRRLESSAQKFVAKVNRSSKYFHVSLSLIATYDVPNIRVTSAFEWVVVFLRGSSRSLVLSTGSKRLQNCHRSLAAGTCRSQTGKHVTSQTWRYNVHIDLRLKP